MSVTLRDLLTVNCGHAACQIIARYQLVVNGVGKGYYCLPHGRAARARAEADEVWN